MISKILNKFSPFTKWTTAVGVFILLFGIIARLIPIYFFWESIFIGCCLIVIGVAGLLVTLIKDFKAHNKKTIALKAGLAIVIFLMFTQLFMAIVIPNSEAYSALKIELLKNTSIQSKVGGIRGFSFIPIGQLSIQEDPADYSGDAYLNVIVKGESKYLFVSVTMHKDYKAKWEVNSIE